MALRLLVTGATGFVGSHVIQAALDRGLDVRALVRATSDVTRLAAAGIERVDGDVADSGAVARAVVGVDAVIHLAGAIKAVDDAAFARVNVDGAREVAAACAGAGVGRLVHVSSLAARGPDGAGGPVSAYGRSKLAGERALLAAAPGVDVLVVRPTAVYGPRDRELLEFFRLARWGIRVIPRRPESRMTLVHAADLARGLVGLIDSGGSEHRPSELPAELPIEVSDGHHYSWPEVIERIARAVGRPGPARSLPDWMFDVAARGAEVGARLTRRPQILDRGKLAELRGSWAVAGRRFWELAQVEPEFDLERGLTATVGAYREAGWLS